MLEDDPGSNLGFTLSTRSLSTSDLSDLTLTSSRRISYFSLSFSIVVARDVFSSSHRICRGTRDRGRERENEGDRNEHRSRLFSPQTIG